MVMKLKRNLKIRMRGNDVKALHEALVAAGFPVKDTLGHFGQKTNFFLRGFRSVWAWMRLAWVINRLLIVSIIKGQVTQPNGNPIVGAKIRVLEKQITLLTD